MLPPAITTDVAQLASPFGLHNGMTMRSVLGAQRRGRLDQLRTGREPQLHEGIAKHTRDAGLLQTELVRDELVGVTERDVADDLALARAQLVKAPRRRIVLARDKQPFPIGVYAIDDSPPSSDQRFPELGRLELVHASGAGL